MSAGHKEGVKPYPRDGARKLNARTWFLFFVAQKAFVQGISTTGTKG